jgi:hypothetical protein
LDVAGQRVTQSENGEKHDQYGIKGDSHVLNKVADRSSAPHHVQAGDAGHEHGWHVDTTIPTMKCRRVASDLRDELKRSAHDDDDGQEQMHGDGDIAHRVARHVSVRHDFVPGGQISSHG